MQQPAIAPSAHPVVSLVDGQAVTTSLEVARVFGKRHDDVLRAIRALILNLPPECLRNFTEASAETAQPNGGTASYAAYTLTRDGFTLLAMGFTGKRALQFKLAYIAAFNRMEAELRAPAVDLRAVMLDGNSDLTVPLPPEVQSALNRRAWTMAHDAYELCREHLARRVAYTSVCGRPGSVHIQRALAVIAEATLDEALTAQHYNQLDSMLLMADTAAAIAKDTAEKMRQAIRSPQPLGQQHKARLP